MPELTHGRPMTLARFFSALCLLGGLVVNGPLVAQIRRPIPQPNPFPPGAAVYEWHYICPHNNPDGTCRFSIAATNYSVNNVTDAQIVLAFQTVGPSHTIPFYYFWITSMGKKKPDFLMLQSNAAVSFLAQGMTMEDDTGPITSEPDPHVNELQTR
jgi:hypothetical protein